MLAGRCSHLITCLPSLQQSSFVNNIIKLHLSGKSHNLIFKFTVLLSGIYISRYLYICLSVSIDSLTHQMTDRVVRYRLDGTDRSVVVSSRLPVTAMTINDKGETHRLNNNHSYNFSCMTPRGGTLRYKAPG